MIEANNQSHHVIELSQANFFGKSSEMSYLMKFTINFELKQ